MFLSAALYCSLIISVYTCNIHQVHNSKICLKFIEYIYENFKTLSVDLVFNLPPKYKLQTIILVKKIFRYMSEAALPIRPKFMDGSKDVFKHENNKHLTIILENTITMKEFLKNVEYRLDENSQWLFIGTEKMNWIKQMKLTFNSQIYLARFMPHFVHIQEAYGINDNVQLRTRLKWSSIDTDKKGNDIVYFERLKYQRDMSGITINIIIFQDPPFVIIKNDTLITAEGFLLDLWKILERGKKFKTNVHFAKSTLEGNLVTKANNGKNYSTGLIKEAEEMHSDVILMLRQDSANYSELFDATTPILTLRLAIYQKISRPNVWQVITQVQSHVITLILTSFGIFCGIILKMIGLETSESLMTVLTTYLQQACTLVPKNLSARLAVISVTLLSMYMVITNIGDCTSLIINQPKPSALTLHDMLDPARKIMVVKDSTTHNIMKKNKTSLMGMILYRVEINHGFVDTIRDGLEKVVKDGYILLEMTAKVAYYFKDFECTVTQTITDFKIPTSLLANWTFPYRKHLDYDLIQMRENGLLSQLIKKWWPDRSRDCEDKFEKVRLDGCWQLFAVFILGTVLAVLVLIIEKKYSGFQAR